MLFQGTNPIKQFCTVWRLYMMYKETMGFVKGLGAGLLAVTAVTAVGSQMMKKDKRLRRSVNKAMHAVGSDANTMVGSVEHMFRG